ncbi:MAG: hypothetical protein ABIE22_02425 [archaeon]
MAGKEIWTVDYTAKERFAVVKASGTREYGDFLRLLRGFTDDEFYPLPTKLVELEFSKAAQEQLNEAEKKGLQAIVNIGNSEIGMHIAATERPCKECYWEELRKKEK